MVLSLSAITAPFQTAFIAIFLLAIDVSANVTNRNQVDSADSSVRFCAPDRRAPNYNRRASDQAERKSPCPGFRRSDYCREETQNDHGPKSFHSVFSMKTLNGSSA